MLPVSFVPIIATITSSTASRSITYSAVVVIIVASECTTVNSTVAAIVDLADYLVVFSTRSSTAEFTFFGSIGFTKVSFGIGTFAER